MTRIRPPWLPRALELRATGAAPYTVALVLEAEGFGRITGRAVHALTAGTAPQRLSLPAQQRPGTVRRTRRPRPITVNGEPGWLLPGALPAESAAGVLCVDPAGASRLIPRRSIALIA